MESEKLRLDEEIKLALLKNKAFVNNRCFQINKYVKNQLEKIELKTNKVLTNTPLFDAIKAGFKKFLQLLLF